MAGGIELRSSKFDTHHIAMRLLDVSTSNACTTNDFHVLKNMNYVYIAKLAAASPWEQASLISSYDTSQQATVFIFPSCPKRHR